MTSSSSSPLDKQIQSLAAGFDALQEEYQRLWSRCQALEGSLETAKAQYAGLTSQCPHKAGPLDLPDTSLDAQISFPFKPSVFSDIRDTAQRNKITAACRLSQQIRTLSRTTSNGVTIHSGPLADKQSAATSAMPSISESPLEQDFTVEGTPSKLGCPFAAMANKKLSSHAASVVSRYRPGTQSGAETPKSSVSRINGRASSVAKASFIDPIKAETCAMESHGKPQDVEGSAQGSTGVCPIRFLNQHSPEEVAAYFELHKHELPRSHEICVKRYQSNEESIRELDAKYGNLVSMITGLGQKHTPMLPEKIETEENENDDEHDRASNEKIRKWASSVGTDAPNMDVTDGDTPDDDDNDDDREPRFERQLRDVRLGESPSRPWGIQVPIDVGRRNSVTSSAAAPAPIPASIAADAEPQVLKDTAIEAEKLRGKCPFGFDAPGEKPAPRLQVPVAAPTPPPDLMSEPEVKPKIETIPKATFISPHTAASSGNSPQMVFTGPVFIGYSLEQAMALLQSSQQNENVKKQH